MPIRAAKLVLLACVITATARSQTPPPEAKFAVEIPTHGGFPDYTTLTGNGIASLFYDQSLHGIAGADPTRPQPTALKLEYNVEGDLVLITASVYFGDFDRQTTPVSLYTLPQHKVGTYSAKLNESVRLSEMEQFGLEPLTLKIVPAQPPVSFRPRTFSKAPSIQIEIIGEDREFYKVALRNLSAKAVTAFLVDMPEQNGGQSQTINSRSRDLIAPGATYQLQFGIPHSGRMINGSSVANPAPPLLVLETAFFKDGSYEGHRQAAAQITASRIGSEIQRQRINQLVQAILADAESDDAAKVARIRSETAQLTEEPDPQMIDRVRSQFPGLPENAMRGVKHFLMSGLNGEKQSVTHGLKEFEQGKARFPNDTLARWWSVWQKP